MGSIRASFVGLRREKKAFGDSGALIFIMLEPSFGTEVRLWAGPHRTRPLQSASATHEGETAEPEHGSKELDLPGRFLFQRCHDGILCARRGEILAVNPAFCSLLGASRAECLRFKPERLFASTDERRDLWRELATRREVVGREVSLARGDGTRVPVRLTAWVLPQVPGESPVFQFLVQDLSEWRNLERQLRHSQKMDSLGRLAGGVAHDLKNLMAVVSGWVELLEESIPEGDPRRVGVDEVMTSIERARNLTRQLLSISRERCDVPCSLDLNQVLYEMEGMLQQLLGADVALVLETEPVPLKVRLDPARFEQILLNLVVNAQEAMPGGGTLWLRTRLRDAGPSSSSPIPAGSARLSVQDTGCGIPPELHARVFEPFFTTKRQGSGLGLSEVWRTVRQLGGEIRIQSAPGRGARFDVDLPLATETRRPRRPSRRETSASLSTVLLIDDESTFREMVARTLERQGYRVLQAASAREALDLGGTPGIRIDLVLCDVCLPGASGPDVARRLQTGHPGVPILFTSGVPLDGLGNLEDLPLFDFLEKPFRKAGLLARIESLLAESGGPGPEGSRNVVAEAEPGRVEAPCAEEGAEYQEGKVSRDRRARIGSRGGTRPDQAP